MTTRRTLLKRAAGAVLGLALARPAPAPAQTPARRVVLRGGPADGRECLTPYDAVVVPWYEPRGRCVLRFVYLPTGADDDAGRAVFDLYPPHAETWERALKLYLDRTA